MRDMARRGARCAVGLITGTAAAAVELLRTALAGLLLLLVAARPRGRRAVLRPVLAGARRLTELERGRLRIWPGTHTSPAYEDAQALGHLACRWTPGVLGGAVMLSVAIGLGHGTFRAYGWLLVDGIRRPAPVVYGSLGGLFLLFLAVQGMFGVAEPEGEPARRLLGPRHQEELVRRIAELSASAAPTRTVVAVGPREGALRVSVEDDGRDGVNPAGSGLFGLARGVAALDGRLEVRSPPGGPTPVIVELPCA